MTFNNYAEWTTFKNKCSKCCLETEFGYNLGIHQKIAKELKIDSFESYFRLIYLCPKCYKKFLKEFLNENDTYI